MAPATKPRKKLIRGPTMAILNSWPALAGSSVSDETPPKMKRVMPWTGSPRRRATREWESSWSRMDTKKRIVVTPEATQRSAVDQWLYSSRSANQPVASQYSRSTKMASQLQWMRISMPKMLPIFSASISSVLSRGAYLVLRITGLWALRCEARL